MITVRYFLSALMLLLALSANAQFILPTPWSEKAMRAEVPLGEYPRPQMQRHDWLCLNGQWEYCGGANAPKALDAQGVPQMQWTEHIRVPYPPESDLSGIRRKQEINMWYRRTFQVPASWKGENVLLNFGAVDHQAVVFINGRIAGTHRGSYDAFSLDITHLLQKGKNELVVAVYDPNDGRAPSGKNGPRGDYTFSSGIWQTVWLEPVSPQHIVALHLIPDVQNERLNVTVEAPEGCIATATAIAEGQTVAKGKGEAGKTFSLPLKDAHLWSPDDPFLYDLRVELHTATGRQVDKVQSYFGMRQCSMAVIDGIARPQLNGKTIFQLGPLDQGYWPDGIFTAPTDSALLYDIELAKRAGFNMIRKHIKVEPQRWYYHCDRLGLLVWQDMPNIWEPDDADSLAVRAEFERELDIIMEQHISAPCIVTWVPFNENWGAFDCARITERVKQHDPSRWVNGHCGYNYAPGYRKAPGDCGNGDFIDIHTYGKIAPREMPKATATRAASLGEFGGKGLFVRGHMWPVRNDAYEMMTSSAQLTDTYIYLLTEVEQMKLYCGLSAAVYTQTTDLEHEINGIVTYDRQVEKMDIPRIREINRIVIEGDGK